MKILFISICFPYPLLDGTRSTIFNLLKNLCKNNEIYLITFIENRSEIDNIKYLEKYCYNIKTILKDRQVSWLKNLIGYFSKFPNDLNRYNLKEMEFVISKTIKYNIFDIVHVDSIYMAQYFRCFTNIPRIIVPRDCMSLSSKRYFKNSKDIMNKIKNYLHWKKIQNVEKFFYQKFDQCIVVTPEDKRELEEICPNLNISVIPIGINLEYFHVNKNILTEEEYSIIFTGVMNYPPNEDAVLYFYNRIFPLIKEKVPEIKFYIVGKNPTEKIKNLNKNPNVTVTGFVNDIRPFIWRSKVYVCYMRLGAGIKNKILEAMSMGMPIVGNKLSFEGIDVVSGVDVIIEDNITNFAKKVIDLMKKKEIRISLGENARRVVENKYSWKKCAKEYQSIYLQTIYNKKNKI